jgi:NTE family protein
MSDTKPKRINLALQGGGAHGAFTWGVLDALLEDGRLDFDGFSGTSAGAMNAAAFAVGWEHGGAESARERLENFWRKVSEAGRPLNAWLFGWAAAGAGMQRQTEWSPGYLAFDILSRFFSPYQLNPFNFHPLRKIVDDGIDFAALRQCRRTKLFVSATAVRTGKIRVFETKEVTTDVLLASACLPYLFHAVEIGGEAYWDGGYMGNPAIFPLIYGCDAKDVVIVQVNPINRPDVPTNARDILDRVTEISFNSSLMREMRAIAFVGRMVEEHKLDSERYKRLNIHFIESETEIAPLGASSKLNTDWKFLCELRDRGRETAKRWLAAHYGQIGRESSVDIRTRFL